MKLYIYCQENDLNNAQLDKLSEQYDEVIQLHSADFTQLKSNEEEKVIALDPDVVGWEFPNDLIDKIPNLKAICLETTGYEWVDYEYCKNKDIIVTNVPHYAGQSVAEKCIFMALALAKKYPLFVREGKMNWDTEFIAEEMRDKPTDIIGFGDIGQKLAYMLENIIGVKEICYVNRHEVPGSKYLHEDFDFILPKSEFMFITCSKNNESLALFDDLSRLNKNCKVVIVANGFEKVAEKMVKMVAEGKLGGVAFESDDLSREYNGNVFVTPHNAYYTKEALEQMFEIWTDTMLSLGSGGVINKIN